MSKEKIISKKENGTAYQEIVAVDRLDLSINIGAVKAFLELLYGNWTAMEADEMSGDFLYLISDARGHLEDALEVLAKAETISA
jgi:hypothetical protein